MKTGEKSFALSLFSFFENSTANFSFFENSTANPYFERVYKDNLFNV